MRVTVIATHPETAPSTRFRVDQYRPHLERIGIEMSYDFLFDQDAYKALRANPSAVRRGAMLVEAMRGRGKRFRRGGLGDVGLVSRELSPVFPGAFMRVLVETGLPLVYDFDDAVFLPQRGGSRAIARVARPAEATAALCREARVVLPGNEFLADFARGSLRGGSVSAKVRVLPTVVDTGRFRPGPSSSGGIPIVGWIGSHSTLPYLLDRSQAFRALARRIPYRLRIVSNAPPPAIAGVDVEFVQWRPEVEVSVFHGLAVGVYPLLDDHWARGKCGFKAIQYSACGVPVVASPVGVLRDIVAPEETGLWADSDDEWCDQIERILRDPDTGAQWGSQGRALVEDRYSIEAGVPVLAAALAEAFEGEPVSSAPPTEGDMPCAASPAS